jgi:hypothetical protein
MGQKLKQYFEKAKEIGGFKAAGKLALLTKIPSMYAEDTPDSPEMIEKFEKAMEQIRKEFY